MTNSSPAKVHLIPIAKIAVVNPRARNKKVFREITHNILEIGLKRPVTVARRETSDGDQYELVCGQGRLEAYIALGQSEIPALVIDASTEDCMVMSLVENLARRQHRSIDLLHDIEGLKTRGYSDAEIAAKTGLSPEYAKAVIRLLEKGEQRLLRAVESNKIPVSVAVDIAAADDTHVQDVLQQAYEKKLLRGHKLIAARRLIEQRQRRGKGLKINASKRKGQTLSSASLVRTYQQDVNRKRLLVRKASTTRDKLTFIQEALRKLFSDENFTNLLRAEDLHTLPRNLADRLIAREAA